MAESVPAEECEFCGSSGPLQLTPRCHTCAPLMAILEGDTLTLKCYLPECQREVARFTVVRPS